MVLNRFLMTAAYPLEQAVRERDRHGRRRHESGSSSGRVVRMKWLLLFSRAGTRPSAAPLTGYEPARIVDTGARAVRSKTHLFSSAEVGLSDSLQIGNNRPAERLLLFLQDVHTVSYSAYGVPIGKTVHPAEGSRRYSRRL